MKRLGKWIVGASALWCLYWALAGWGIRSAVSAWFETQAKAGWQIELGEISATSPFGGFPFRHSTRLLHPTLADPNSGLAWSAQRLDLSSPAIWPGIQELRFADGVQRLSHFDQTLEIRSVGLITELELAPGLDLPLQNLALRADQLGLEHRGATQLAADNVQLRMAEMLDANSYSAVLAAQHVQFSPEILRMLRSSPTRGDQLDSISVLADLRFDAPWDRHALEHRRPQPRAIELRHADVQWGEMRVYANGKVAVGPTGLLTGEVTLQLDHWQQMLELASDLGLTTPRSSAQLQGLGEAFAQNSASASTLDITLNIRDGLLRLGPIPVGRAPRLLIR